jgi:FlaA1/EpsC-like NDP-sugar epimerase
VTSSKIIHQLAAPLLRASRNTRRMLAAALDIAVITASLCLAMGLRFSGIPTSWPVTMGIALTAILVALSVFLVLGLYRSLIRSMSATGFAVILLGCSLAGIALWSIESVPVDVAAGFAAFSALGSSALRVAIRGTIGSIYGRIAQPVIIYGAGESGRQIAQVMLGSSVYRPVAFIDDSRELQGALINGLPVRPASDLPLLADRFDAKTVVLAMPSVPRSRRRDILRSIAPAGLAIRSLPDLRDIVAGKVSETDLRSIDIADVLGRDMVPPDARLLASNLTGKAVMVTGAGGSIGSELCRQILSNCPRRLVLFELSEVALYDIESELRAFIRERQAQTELIALLGDVRETARLEQALRLYEVQTLYHAAAYKHVPIVEENVTQGVQNNVFGSWSAAEAAVRAGVEVFVLISTDKAVNPTNVMGATKRLAELVLQGLQEQHRDIIFSMVRFGNVLGSSGSVVPRFEEQIRKGGPVTVTHPDIVRYFMTIPEAAQLVIQAGAMAKGGEVFVLDMGAPVRIADLARRMIELSGHRVRESGASEEGIEIVYTGLRPAEKLFEELLIGGNVSGTDHPMIMRAMEHLIPWTQLEPQLQKLRTCAAELNSASMVAVLKNCVSEYQPAAQLHDLLAGAERRHATSVRLIEAR